MKSERNLRGMPAAVGEAEVVAVSEIARAARVRRAPFGFPSAVASDDDDQDGATTDRVDGAPIRLSDVVARQPATTFFVRMAIDALLDSGIYAGDVLVVDRMLRPHYGALTVVTLDNGDGLNGQEGIADALDPLDGPMLVRHYCPDRTAIHLLPAHPDVAPISVSVVSVNGRARLQARVHVWGVVTGVVRERRTI